MNTPGQPKNSPRIVNRTLFALAFAAAARFGAAGFAQDTTPTAGEEAVKLEPFQITAGKAEGYSVQDASSSSRINLAYIDTPQTVNVLTNEFLEDTDITTTQHMIEWVNNVTGSQNGLSQDSYTIRGLAITTSYLDGFLTSSPEERDSALLDRVEFVKGPASAAIGRGQAAGLINYVSKKPVYGSDFETAKFTVATDDYYRFEADINRVVSKSLAIRIPMYYEDANATWGQSINQTTRYGMAPTALWKISKSTELWVKVSGWQYQAPVNTGVTDYYDTSGIMFKLRQTLNQYVGSAWNPSDPYPSKDAAAGFTGLRSTDHSGDFSAIMTSDLTDVLTLRLGLLAEAHQYHDIVISDIGNTLPGSSPTDFLQPFQLQDVFLYSRGLRQQGDLLFDKTIGPTSNKVDIGYDTFALNSANKSGFAINPQTGTVTFTDDLYDPQHIVPAGTGSLTNPPITAKAKTNQKGFGYYGQYLGSYWHDRINIILGARDDITQTTTFNLINHTYAFNQRIATAVPRYSIDFKPIPNLSVYYLRSYQEDPPVTQLEYSGIVGQNGGTVPPPGSPIYSQYITGQVKAKLDEVGVKGNFLQDQLTGSFAFYSLTRSGAIGSYNQYVLEPTPQFPNAMLLLPTSYLTSGEQYWGYEFEVSGHIGNRFTYRAGYAIPMGKASFAGMLVPAANLIRTPEAFCKYDQPLANGSGLVFSFGMRELIGNWQMRVNSYVKYTPSQYTGDAGVAYYWKHHKYEWSVYCHNFRDQAMFTSTNSFEEFRRIYTSFALKL